MSQLIKIKQRLNAIATIKKITHAMRLISMSAHTRMQKKSSFVRASLSTIKDIVNTTYITDPQWDRPLLSPVKARGHLVILIGSQKGLCGNFNNLIFAFFERHFAKKLSQPISYIAIGKKAADFLAANQNISLIKRYDTLSMPHIQTITKELTNHILTMHPPYSHITVVSSLLKNFFIHQPHINTLVPFEPLPTTEIHEAIRWEQNKQYVFDSIAHEYFFISLYYYIFESVLAEQATRFLAMDKATRNSDQMLDDMNLMYNKLRQAKITRELTELMASF